MAKTPFTREDIESKGYYWDEVSQTYLPKPKGVFGNLSIFPKSFTDQPGNEPTSEVKDVVVDIKTEWIITYNVPALKNSKQIIPRKGGGHLIIPSKKHQEYVKMTEMQYSVFGIEFRRAVKFYGLEYPLRIEFTFIRSSKNSFDYGNILQTCEDIMKDKKDKKGNVISVGWIPDDSADFILPVFQPYQYDKENPGVKIKLIIK